ncbi:MAG: BamA/TamA family outer membrane protein [Candidatus Adiutrix sp.]|jgi:translocation and assembly module TamA|nr:BamA/TamA family outer membrane protein [Candidatus Adiutrix sp.]
MIVRGLILLTGALFLAGCGAFHSPEPEAGGPAVLGSGKNAPASGGPALHATIPAPAVPPELKARAGASSQTRGDDGRLYSYTLDVQSPEDPELADAFEKVSRLALMKDQPATMTTLEQRLNVSLEEARSLLKSRGYYEGTVEGRLTAEGADKARAVFSFRSGPRYSLGPSRIILDGALAGESEAPAPPRTLAEVGLTPGGPALADEVLAAVSRVEDAFRNRGYPLAAVEGARYTVDRAKRSLEAEIQVKPGRFARMGEVLPVDGATVDQGYLDALRPWAVGQPWHQEQLDNYLGALRQTGLFQSVEAFPASENDPRGYRPISVKLVGAPERTVGGLLSYDTDFGPGLTAYWEHRNLTGHGDRLRLDLPLWADMQEFTATYRYPYFLGPDQDIVARGGFLHQDTDAYELSSGAAAVGLERRLSRRLTVSLMGSVEGGSLRDPDQDKKEFIMFGLPAAVNYDSTGSLLDPTRGLRLMLQAAPYTGSFHQDFNVFRSRLEAQGFVPLGSDDRFVLALRGVWGSLWGVDNSQTVPSALRFYSGGGGSVRGYDYQSVGPRNEKLEPLGGVSQVELGAEARWRFLTDMGLVAFIDGGMVYENVDEKIFQNMLWGAGLGYRYYTAIGPVRLDVAFPLDKRPDDDDWQLYLSLGQSF